MKIEISHKVHRHVDSIHNMHAGMDELIRKLCWAKKGTIKVLLEIGYHHEDTGVQSCLLGQHANTV